MCLFYLLLVWFFFFNDTATTEIYTLSLHDALPIWKHEELRTRHEAQTVEQAREIADALEQSELRFDVKAGPAGALFGSVTATAIVDELWRERRIRVDRRKIELPEPIKRVGRYEIPIEVFTDVTAEVRVLVVPEGGELPPEEELVAEAEEAEPA